MGSFDCGTHRNRVREGPALSGTQLRELKCPNCGSAVTLPPGATRTTCPYCGTTFAVNLDETEAEVYAVDQEVRSQDKDRLALERSQLYNQYRAWYSELDDIDAAINRAGRPLQTVTRRSRDVAHRRRLSHLCRQHKRPEYPGSTARSS